MVAIISVIFIITGLRLYSKESLKNNEDISGTVADIEIKVAEPRGLMPQSETFAISAEPATDTTNNKVNYNDYTISLDIDPITRNVTGIEKLKYTNDGDVALHEIYFNLYLNAFSETSPYKPYFENFEKKIFQSGEDYGFMGIKKVTINDEQIDFTVDTTIMKIDLKTPLLPGDDIEISLLFEAYVPAISHRTGANAKAIWFGNFLPQVAVHDSSGWHLEPYNKAGDPSYSEISNYHVTITTPMGYHVVSTGVEIELENEDTKITTVNIQMVRDFAFVVSPAYSVESVRSDLGVDINFYYYSDIPDIQFYLNSAKESLEYFTNLIGSYPYLSLDIVETELFMEAGMEYPQIIFMDSDYLQKRVRANSTIVHEVAHQWFYNVIGNDQVNAAWLDESLAGIVQDLFLYSEEELEANMITNYNTLISRIENIENPIPGKNTKLYDSWNSYYNVEYLRPKIMLYELRKKMGIENFELFLKTYYNKYAFQEVVREDLTSTAEEVYGSELQSFFSAWLGQHKVPPLQ